MLVNTHVLQLTISVQFPCCGCRAAGVTTAPDVVCVATSSTGSQSMVADSTCSALARPAPPSRPCNKQPCASSLSYWTAGPWSACTPLYAGTCAAVGVHTRAVACRSHSGHSPAANASVACAAAPALSPSLPCDTKPACGCSAPVDCMNPRMACVPEYPGAGTGRCQCSGGWGGPACASRLLGLHLAPPYWDEADGVVGYTMAGPTVVASTVPGCTAGVVDVRGGCCAGVIDAESGLCCGAGAVVDKRGRCCDAGLVDACGVCAGGGVAVDVTGECCPVPLPLSGVCCVDGDVDDCGVCGGVSECEGVVTLAVSGRYGPRIVQYCIRCHVSTVVYPLVACEGCVSGGGGGILRRYW